MPGLVHNPERLRAELGALDPGSMLYVPEVLDPDMLNIAGQKVLAGEVAWGETFESYRWSEWIPIITPDIPRYLLDIVEPIGLTLPFDGSLELVRLRHYFSKACTEPHYDAAEDLRVIIPLVGIDYLDEFHRYSNDKKQEIIANPGDVVVINNMVGSQAHAQLMNPNSLKPVHQAYGEDDRVV